MRVERFLIITGLIALAAFVAVAPWRPPEPAQAQHIAALSAGGMHTCALTEEGGVQCWGLNNFAQLGDGTNTDSVIPVDVVGLESGVAAVAAGAINTCALTTVGGVQCWGRGIQTPQPVPDLESGAVAIAAGFDQNCALMIGGGVKCWGNNGYGSLGDGTTTSSAVPVDVLEEPGGAPLSGAVAIASGGGWHTCALTEEGGVQCWGYNQAGQVGDGTDQNIRTTPVDVVGLQSGVVAITAGESHTCAVTAAGGLKCWGYNMEGEVGDGTQGYLYPVPVPADVSGLQSGVAAVSAGGDHTCALLEEEAPGRGGAVKCWGANFFGQVGDGTEGFENLYRVVPTDVLGMSSGVAAVSAGGAHTCAILTGGAVTCWGLDMFGQLGDTDGDGCTDFAENGPDPALGGGRDFEYYWDFFDIPNAQNARDRTISVGDVFGVVQRFGTNGDPGIDPKSAPPASGYHTAFDRGGPIGDDVWERAPPDGSVSVGDISAVVGQFGHSCG